jgi:GNAT superfamily N-acetyltransferase
MSALRPATLEVVDRYWADWLGCEVGALRPAATLVCPHGPGLSDYDGTFVLLAGGAPVVSLPPALLAELAPAARRWSVELVRDPVGLVVAHHPVRLVARVVGPAWVGYADAGSLRSPADGHAQLLTAADAPRVAALRRACTPEEWAHGGHTLEEGAAAGAFVDGHLAALAGYTRWGEHLAHISVVVHPAHRGLGFGRAVVARVAAEALAVGLVAQYRTLEVNAPARAVAASLGFVSHLASVAARYRPTPPGQSSNLAE